MTRSLLLLVTPFALTACVDDFGGMPAPDRPVVEAHCVDGLCLEGDTRLEMQVRADALDTCAPQPDEFGLDPDPSGLAVGGIALVQGDGGPVLEVELFNLDPQGFWAYPGLSVEVLDGALRFPEQPWAEAPTHVFGEQYYGITGCGRYTVRAPLQGLDQLDGPVTLRASATVLHAPAAADTWVFTLSPEAR